VLGTWRVSFDLEGLTVKRRVARIEVSYGCIVILLGIIEKTFNALIILSTSDGFANLRGPFHAQSFLKLT
jgi:hypothetical protein